MFRRNSLLLVLFLVTLTPTAGTFASTDSGSPDAAATTCPSGASTTAPNYDTAGPSPWDYGAMRSYSRAFVAAKFDPFKTRSFWFLVYEFPNSRFPAAWLNRFTVDVLRDNYKSQDAPALKLEEIPFPFALTGDGCRAFAGRLDEGEIHPRIMVVVIHKDHYVWLYSASGIAADFAEDLAPMIALIPEDPDAIPGTGLSGFLPLPREMPVGYISAVEEQYPTDY